MELRRIDSFCLKLLFLAEAGIIITQVLNLETLTSALFLLTFPLTVLLWIRTVRTTVSETDMVVIVTCVLAVVSVLLNAAQANAQMSFDYLKKLIMFVMTLLFFQTAYRVRADEKVCAFILRVMDLVVLFLILMYFLQYRQMHMLNGRRTLYLTFGFSNPNLTALFLQCIYMLKMRRLFEKGTWYVKLWHILQQAILAWFVVETQSRNGLLVMAVYTVSAVWLIFRSRRSLRIGKGWAALFATFPAVLVAGYMLLINNRWVLNTFSFLAGVGKELDSREDIWSDALSFLKGSPLFGAYCEASNGSGVLQMHNSHLDIAVSYGVPVLLLVCFLLIRYLHRRGHIYGNRKDYVYIMGFAFAILLGMGEAAVFSGGLGLYILAGAFLLLAGQDVSE